MSILDSDENQEKEEGRMTDVTLCVGPSRL